MLKDLWTSFDDDKSGKLDLKQPHPQLSFRRHRSLNDTTATEKDQEGRLKTPRSI